jgi:hypothetical protein
MRGEKLVGPQFGCIRSSLATYVSCCLNIILMRACIPVNHILAATGERPSDQSRVHWPKIDTNLSSNSKKDIDSTPSTSANAMM